MDEAISQDRWLPPSPHREEVLKFIERGRAHIEERGHGVPPLLVFEDGGAIELPKVRYAQTRRGMQFVAAEETLPSDQTKHPDVCGTLDELKGLLKENPRSATSDPALFHNLLEHIYVMISRMQRRRELYRSFAKDIAARCKQLATVEGPAPEVAYKKVDQITAILRDDSERVPDRLDELFALAEGIRDVANKLEKCLYAHRDAAIEIGALYDEIRGGRNWKRKEEKPA